MSADDRSGIRVRWLVAGAFSATPEGRRFAVTQQGFGATFEAAKLSVKAEVPDRLGSAATRTLEVSFPSVKAFQGTEVVASSKLLQELSTIGASLGQADATKRPDPDTAVSKVVALAGDGKLAATLRAKLGVSAAKPAASSGPASAGDVDVDDLLSKAGAPPEQVKPAGLLDSFVKAMRPASGATTAPAAGRAARDAIEAEVFGTAVDVLRAPAVAKLEAAWRSLKLLVDACPESAGVAVDVIDVDPQHTLDAVRDALPTLPEDEAPDAIFVFDPVDSPDGLLALANLGADNDIPVIACVSQALFGQTDPSTVSGRIEDEDGSLPSTWRALREDDATRWLTVVNNRPVVRVEGNGVARRVVFGSAVAALGAMLSTSFFKSGAFARILGAGNALKAPGAYELPSGRDAGNLVPTEAFYSIRAQNRLAALGIAGLGSGRNSDALLLTSAPTVRSGEDVVPLSAQILTGRIVRFARWVLAQLPAKSVEQDVKLLFEQAASVFLFPTAQEGAKLEAQVVTNADGRRSVVIAVSVRAELAGIPFHLGFGLPLPD